MMSSHQSTDHDQTRLLGIAIRTNNTLELGQPSMVWKPLVGQELEVGDLTAIDQIAVSAMTLITDDKALAEKGIDESNFEDGQPHDAHTSSLFLVFVLLMKNYIRDCLLLKSRHVVL
jgi:hypothetical protein